MEANVLEMLTLDTESYLISFSHDGHSILKEFHYSFGEDAEELEEISDLEDYFGDHADMVLRRLMVQYLQILQQMPLLLVVPLTLV
jgi:hypothetical protein